MSDSAGGSNKLGLRIGANNMVVTGDFDKSSVSGAVDTKAWLE